MRFLFIVYRDFQNPAAVGGDLYLWELARGLSAHGHTVVMTCSSFPGSEHSQEIDGIKIVRIPGSLIMPLNLLKVYLTRFRGNFHFVVEEVFGGQRLPFLATLYVKEQLLAVWHQKNAKIFREQYPAFVALPLSFLEFATALLYRGRTILTPSKGAKATLSVLGFKNKKVRVVYDGVGKEFLNLGWDSKRENMIVCLGKLRRYKRIDHAIMAFAKVLEITGEQVKLVIAGKLSEIDRDYVNSLRRLADKMGIADKVEFRINISELAKLDLLRKAKVLVQPSPIEGFSIVVAEANRCGTPVVVSDGTPFDVVHHGVNGLVYRYGDIEAFADRICMLLGNDAVWKRFSISAYDWSRRFTWESAIAQLEGVLTTLSRVDRSQFSGSTRSSLPRLQPFKTEL